VFGAASPGNVSRHRSAHTFMRNLKLIKSVLVLALAIASCAVPVSAQQRRGAPAPAKKPARAAPEVAEVVPTFDSLLAADSFKVYGEIRGIGGLIRSTAVTDVLDPVMKVAAADVPKEFKTALKWLNSHSDALAGSRMMIAAWPSRPGLPNVVVAIEFASTEDAKKFYPELRDFMPKLLASPTPTPTPTPAPATPLGAQAPAMPSTDGERTAQRVTTEVLPYHMKQTGSLILISDAPISVRDLRPRRSKALEEDQNFVSARNRFASEPVFLYVDLKAIEKEEKDRRRKWQEEDEKRAANPPPIEEITTAPETEEMPPAPDTVEETPVPSPPPATPTGEATLSATPQSELSAGPILPLGSFLFGGETKWPEAVSAALVFEGDGYVLRALIINSFENKSNALPFLSQFVAGPEIAPQSPNVFPADADLFVSASLDYQQIYDGMLKAIANSDRAVRIASRSAGAKDSDRPISPFAFYEQKLGLKIKEDILPLFGSEVALVMPKKATKPIAEEPAKAREDERPPQPASPELVQQSVNPVIAISVKDREAVAKLIPKLIEVVGLKGANLLAQTEKHDGAEIVSYAGFFSYAFIADFLVLSPEPRELKRVVESYLEHQTLAGDSHFRNYTRWQPRQVLGQVYVAPTMVEEYMTPNIVRNQPAKEFLSRVAPVIDPLTYSLSNDSVGPLHELHVPKNLLQVLVANMAADAEQAPLRSNEAMARNMLYSIVGSEATFKSGKGAGSYATLDQLIAEQMISKHLVENFGYHIELITMGDKFEASAIPLEYGKTGKLSFFMDETGVLRGADHGGGAATVADDPLR
jgi:hypothetical protein